MSGDKPIIVRFDQIFAVQGGRFVPKLDLSVDGVTLAKGEFLKGSTLIQGVPLYALMNTDLQLQRLFEGVVEMRIPQPGPDGSDAKTEESHS